MKAILLLTAILTSAVAQAQADDVFYCGGLSVEGAYVKVDPTAGTMCISAGAWSPEYCNNASETFTLKSERRGTVKIEGRDFSFYEFLGVNETTGKSQWVRSFDEASNVSIALVTVHRADLAGVVTLINTELPSKEANDGEATCIRGPDDSF